MRFLLFSNYSLLLTSRRIFLFSCEVIKIMSRHLPTYFLWYNHLGGDSMIKTFSGYCPTQNKQYSVSVNYIDVSDFEEPKQYVKGLASCKFLQSGNQCFVDKCPLIDLAPEHL